MLSFGDGATAFLLLLGWEDGGGWGGARREIFWHFQATVFSSLATSLGACLHLGLSFGFLDCLVRLLVVLL